VAGDGGFAHNWAELETVRRLGTPIIILMLNNGILGFQTHAEDMKFGEHTNACDFVDVDHAAIARACGINGVRVSNGVEVQKALDDAFASKTATFIEVITDPHARPPYTMFAEHFREMY
jgi:acetolactate synthase-1/2/3 large subunit